MAFSFDDTRRSASAAPLSHGTTSLKIHVRFADVGAKSVDVKHILFNRYLEYIKIELAKQCFVFICVYLFSLGKPMISC